MQINEYIKPPLVDTSPPESKKFPIPKKINIRYTTKFGMFIGQKNYDKCIMWVHIQIYNLLTGKGYYYSWN